MKKKVLFVIGSLHIGGAEKSLITLLQNIEYSDKEVTLLLFAKGGEFESLVPQQVRIQYLTPPKLSLFDKLKYGVEKIRKSHTHPVQIYWKYVRKYYTPVAGNFDYAISYNQGFANYFVSEFVNARVKYGWMNTDYVKAKYDVYLDLPHFENYDAIIPVSEEADHTFRRVIDTTNIKLKTVIIKDITDRKILEEQSLQNADIPFSKNHINILTVGRLSKPKGLELAVRACKILKDKGQNVKWFVVGEGPERKSLQKLIIQYNLSDTFILLGAKSNPYPFMKNCDIYVQTSWFEGLGLTLIEAAVLCKPLVTTNFITASSIVKDKETGLICETTAKSISNAILTLINDKELMMHFQENLGKIRNKDKEKSLETFERLLQK